MESLESRLERLSPEQRKEVEDFVDFLVFRSSQQPVPAPAMQPATSPLATAPPVLSISEPAPDPQIVRIPSAIRRSDPAGGEGETGPRPVDIREIASEKDEDPLTAGYLDYGRFETDAAPPPGLSQADEAVQRVRIKLSGKKKDEPVNNLLEWID